MLTWKNYTVLSLTYFLLPKKQTNYDLEIRHRYIAAKSIQNSKDLSSNEFIDLIRIR